MTTPTPKPQPTTTTTCTFSNQVHLPRITIKFCTQCKWMLRAAYFAQELLSTFSTDLGEVALVPCTGGVFTVTIYSPVREGEKEKEEGAEQGETGEGSGSVTTREVVLWDRKRDGGFPEVKALKSLVRNVIDPSRDLGHTDRALRAAKASTTREGPSCEERREEKKTEACEDCQ